MRLLQTTDQVRQVVYTNDGTRLVTGEGDWDGIRSLNVWDLRDGRRAQTVHLPGSPRQIAVTTSRPTLLIGYILANQIVCGEVADNLIEVVSMSEPLSVGPQSTLAISADGESVAFNTIPYGFAHYRSPITTFRRDQPDSTATFFTGTPVQQLMFQPGKPFLASAGAGQYTIWDLIRRESWRVGTHPELGPMAYAPDGSCLAIAARNSCMIWDEAQAKILRTIPMPTDAPITVVAFSPDGRLAAVASGQIIHLVAVDSGTIRQSFGWNIGPIFSIAFSPDGLTAAAGGANRIIVWDLDD